jgi:hypothetical protein
MQSKLYGSVYEHQVSWNATLSIRANLDSDSTLIDNNFSIYLKENHFHEDFLTNFINRPLTSNDGIAIFQNHENTFRRLPTGRKVQDFGVRESFLKPLPFSWSCNLLSESE